MKPRILILNGALEAKVFSLENSELFTIGRSLRNRLPIPDSVMSREHAVIQKMPDGFFLEDLNSQNGIFVNSDSVQKILLKHGDRIRIGQTQMLFLTAEYDTTEVFSSEIRFDDDLTLTQSDFIISHNDSVRKLSTELNVLTKIGAALNESRTSEELQKKLLEIILEIIPAERCAFVLLNEDLISPNAVCVLDKIKADSEPMHISRSISRQVLVEKASILKNDIYINSLPASESILGSGINAILCVPLMSAEISGFIYLDSRNSTFKFQESHLQQMTAIGSLAASALKNVRYYESLKIENESLQNRVELETNMIGESEAMKTLSHLIGKVSRTDSTILISGESGTGKELVAHAIHKNSLRNNKPFVALNCAVLTDNFLDSDLFGYEKGAFTGATAQRKGKIETAEGGTLFLDEIGELAPALQAKLLRVIQEREFERIGGTKIIKAEIRLLAATNRNLAEEVKKGNFREDLYFRLNVVEIKAPPLRQRKSDILLLAQHFTQKYSELCKRRVHGISHPAKQALVKHEWRGNVRELKNVIERAVVLGSADTIQAEDLPFDYAENPDNNDGSPPDLNQQLKVAKRKIVLTAIRESGGNYSEAARRLSIHPNNLHRIIRELEIREEAKNII